MLEKQLLDYDFRRGYGYPANGHRLPNRLERQGKVTRQRIRQGVRIAVSMPRL